ncbi:GNAT family N-acetyltransferase [Pelagibacterium sp. H642]|uniref:GNAT family N-acetyltransferase n=1 Tax=Pelagibacterium sp. H642 TaxID=1881069 RepID=UPI0028157CBB|nr:GNAT family N-acetyltransferase [Pelagibacterium sp. H642]WMT89611.1 GNAT family N-acetyltransferase [Pelagibacterium sp. H642]
MADLLVRLYDLPEYDYKRVIDQGVTLRRALAPERASVCEWVETHFSRHWRSEVETGFSHQPIDVWIAHDADGLLGFACGDVTARGFFGPTGVAEDARGRGIGEALLFKTLQDLESKGFAYAVIGDPGPVDFYKNKLDATEIPASKPGIYRGMLK